MKEELLTTLGIYHVPSEAMWRAFELRKLTQLKKVMDFEAPVLEIGCGDGAFGSLIFSRIHQGIDLNERAVARCQALHGDTYASVHSMDARNMSFAPESFQTVFANCVIEHIPDLQGVIQESYRMLAPDGKFVTTVPLIEMNRHLIFGWEKYADFRQGQLQHVNLLSANGWCELFKSSGFARVELFSYLGARNCRLWDALDSPLTLGFQRYRVGAITRKIIKRLPDKLRHGVHEHLASWLDSRIVHEENANQTCAAVLVAHKYHN